MTKVLYDLSKVRIDLTAEINRAHPISLSFTGECHPGQCVLNYDNLLLLYAGKYSVSYTELEKGKRAYTTLKCYVLEKEDMNNLKMALVEELI